MLNLPAYPGRSLLSALIGGLAYRRGSLTRSGWLGAVLTGTLTFGFGGWTWGLTLIAFFVTSSALSHFRQGQKQRSPAKSSRRAAGAISSRRWRTAALARCWRCPMA